MAPTDRVTKLWSNQTMVVHGLSIPNFVPTKERQSLNWQLTNELARAERHWSWCWRFFKPGDQSYSHLYFSSHHSPQQLQQTSLSSSNTQSKIGAHSGIPEQPVIQFVMVNRGFSRHVTSIALRKTTSHEFPAFVSCLSWSKTWITATHMNLVAVLLLLPSRWSSRTTTKESSCFFTPSNSSWMHHLFRILKANFPYEHQANTNLGEN